MTLRHWIGRNWFLIGLLVAVAGGWVWTDPGANGGLLRPEISVPAGIAAIFFFQGLTLPLETLRKGILEWRLHLTVQLGIFLVVPLLGLAFTRMAGSWMTGDLRLGFLFLAVLPTTVSSAMVYTAVAEGNAAAALFNTSFSNVIGVVLTPLWLSWMVKAHGVALPLAPMLRGIALLILGPLLAGQIVRPFIRHAVDRRKKRFNQIASLIILFVVYSTFCNSLRSGVFSRNGAAVTLGALAATLVFFVVVTFVIAGMIRLLRFRRADAAAVLFCGSQKTLAAGIPMGKLIFASSPGLGVILLPLMFYHPLQLLLGGFLVDWFKKRHDSEKRKSDIPGARQTHGGDPEADGKTRSPGSH